MPRKSHLPHLRLHNDGTIYLWIPGFHWKRVGAVVDGFFWWRRTSWPIEFAEYMPSRIRPK